MEKTMLPSDVIVATCPCCGKDFTYVYSGRRRRIYCSPECRAEYNKKKLSERRRAARMAQLAKLPERRCPVCGKVVVSCRPGRPRIYCGPLCANAGLYQMMSRADKDAKLDRLRENREYYKRLGRCPYCREHTPVEPGYTRCKKCRMEHTNYYAGWRAKKKRENDAF